MLSIKSFTFNPLRENTYVIYNEQGWCAIIDPGAYFNFEQNDLKSFIEREQLQPKYLLNTHCHLDHVFGNRFVADTWQLPLYIHPLEKELLQLAPAMAVQWGMPFEGYEGPLHFLQPGNQLKLGNDLLDILFTPGHSPGSVCFYCAAQRFVISGDVLFYESIGRTDLPGGDHATLLQSIRSELWPLPDDLTIYPGHGPSTTLAHEKEHNPFLH
ncbi:MAG TPA: MBL fold metallo-hydrolase [Chitinophagaceae bacterium]|nr:MBL fold metallo-hydrolase [Chitinophagaceae bacterium]